MSTAGPLKYNPWNDTCPDAPFLQLTPTYSIQDLPIILPCIGALIIGLHASKQIRSKTTLAAKWLYHIPFLSFGIMMTCAMILHCFVHDGLAPLWHPATILILADGSLTSFVALSFMFAGLTDLEILDPKAERTKYIAAGSYVSLLLGYLTIWSHPNFAVEGYIVLYVGVIAISGFVYLITQIILIHHSSSKEGVGSLVVGGGAGVVAILSLAVFNNQICNYLGPQLAGWFGPNFIWYFLSDVSVYFLYMYVLKSQHIRPQETEEMSYSHTHHHHQQSQPQHLYTLPHPHHHYVSVPQSDDREMDYVIGQNYAVSANV